MKENKRIETEGKCGLNSRNATNMSIIESSIGWLRDPCVLTAEGKYYVYGTGYLCFCADSLDSESWTEIKDFVSFPEGHEADGDRWAPEVHYYRGSYYMFTTYHSSKTRHRGCTILKSASPAGPFTEITNGHITPHDWDSIDGTFYIDKSGKPWMVFVHEWTSTDDGIGRMAAAKLSDGLTHFISEPIELFRADDPSWSKGAVTDGCWMYRTEKGTLLMLWSNWDKYGYCVGIARSDNGEVDGKWSQDDKLLYSKSLTGLYDGGHSMIFKDYSNKMYLSLHSPNDPQGERNTKPIFIELAEDSENDTLVLI